MKSRNLFIGILILFIGVVSLLNSLDVIDFSWSICLRLWPILLIFIGIAILPIKEWLKALLLVVALAAGVLLYQQEAKDCAERSYWTSWTTRNPFKWFWWWDD